MNNNIQHTELPIESIILIEENPREISDSDLDKLCEDIKNDPNFLYQRPSLINSKDNKYYCYAGTQRIKAQIRLGSKTAICFIEEGVPIKLQRERMLKDNLHRGRWDTDKLLSLDFEISELEDIGFDLPGIGIDMDLLKEPTDLTSELKDNPPTIKVTFTDVQQMEKFEKKIKDLQDKELYPEFEGFKYSLSVGEL